MLSGSLCRCHLQQHCSWSMEFKVALWKGTFFPTDHSGGLLRCFVHMVHRVYCKGTYLFTELVKILASSPVYFNWA